MALRKRTDTLRKRTDRGISLLLCIFVITAAVSVSVATQHSALAADCAAPQPKERAVGSEVNPEPTYYLDTTSTCEQIQLPLGHVCTVLGVNESQVRAYECTNVYANTNPNDPVGLGSVDVYGVGTYYCATDKLATCAGMNVVNNLGSSIQHVLHNSGTDPVDDMGSYYCLRECPDAAEAYVATTHEKIYVDDIECLEVWPWDNIGNEIDLADVNGTTAEIAKTPLGVPHFNVCI
jgi:hypothetical protein